MPSAPKETEPEPQACVISVLWGGVCFLCPVTFDILLFKSFQKFWGLGYCCKLPPRLLNVCLAHMKLVDWSHKLWMQSAHVPVLSQLWSKDSDASCIIQTSNLAFCSRQSIMGSVPLPVYLFIFGVLRWHLIV